MASGLRVPAAVGDFMILDAVRASRGSAVAVPEDGIAPWMKESISLEGLAICPETAVCFSALERLLARGDIQPEERIVVFNTGAAQKYPEAVREEVPLLDVSKPVDWSTI